MPGHLFIQRNHPGKSIIYSRYDASEKEIKEALQKAIDPIIKSRTSILIAHRLSTIMAADEILVIKDGIITERGRHDQLLELDGVYSELYHTQFSKAD